MTIRVNRKKLNDRTALAQWLMATLGSLIAFNVAANINQLKIGAAQIDATTPHTVSLVLPTTLGDQNRSGVVQLYYRRPGGDWQETHPMYQHNNAPRLAQPFAGMVFGLQENTLYEIKLTVFDENGVQGRSEQKLWTRTSRIPPRQVGSERIITNSNELHAALRSASGDAENRQVLLLQPGEYRGAFLLQNYQGNSDKPLVIRGTNRDDVVISGDLKLHGVSNVHVEDLTIRSTGIGLQVRGHNEHATQGVVLRGNRIISGKIGIDARGEHRDLIVRNNVLRGPNEFGDTSNKTWNHRGIMASGEGIDIGYNTIAGFGDSVALSNKSTLPNRGVDIHHNKILWGGDDGIELDFSHRNTQAHHNLIANTASSISCQMVIDGPAYIYRNVSYNTLKGPYKIKPESDTNDGLFFYNNSSFRHGSAWLNYSGNPDSLTIINNYFHGGGKPEYQLRFPAPEIPRLRMSHNAWVANGNMEIGNIRKADFIAWRKSPYGRRDLMLGAEPSFTSLKPDFSDTDFNSYRDPEVANFELAAFSQMVDNGREVPGITEGFIGNGPDIGAWERGATPPNYGANHPLPDK